MEICLISCNIRFDNPADDENSWAHRRDFLTEVLINHNPSIIATQEGRFEQLYDFQNLLKNFDLLDQHRSWIKPRMYPSFFLKKNQFEVIKSEDLWLSSTPNVAGSSSFNSTFPRLMTWMKIQLRDSSDSIFIVNTHLDHIHENTRIKQIEVLGEEISKKLDPNSKLIIMGDFNDRPQSKVREILLNRHPQLIDAWTIFNSSEESSHHAFAGEVQNGSRIDWILIDKSIEIVDCFLDKSHRSGKYPSDHFPVVCKIKF